MGQNAQTAPQINAHFSLQNVADGLRDIQHKFEDKVATKIDRIADKIEHIDIDNMTIGEIKDSLNVQDLNDKYHHELQKLKDKANEKAKDLQKTVEEKLDDLKQNGTATWGNITVTIDEKKEDEKKERPRVQSSNLLQTWNQLLDEQESQQTLFSLPKYDQAQLDKAASKLDRWGNIIPETDEELMAMVKRMEEDQQLLVNWEWHNITVIDPKMRGNKYELLKALDFKNRSDFDIAEESVYIQEKLSKQIVHQLEEFLQFFSIEADIEIHNGNIVGKVTEFANNAGFVVDAANNTDKMNYIEKRVFSRLMLDIAIAAYHKSMLDTLLKAPFSTNDTAEWTEQLRLMRYVKTRFDYLNVTNFNQDKFLADYITNWASHTNKTLVNTTFFLGLNELANQMADAGHYRGGIYQDIKEKWMSPKEAVFHRALVDYGKGKDEIYSIFFEYKTQQLTFALQQIIEEELNMADIFPVDQLI